MYKSSKGLTLIELSVVIGLIAILAFAVAPRFFDLSSNAEETSAHQLLHSLKTAATMYTAQEYNSPQAFDNFVILKGKVSGSKTLTLENIQDLTTNITMQPSASTLSVNFNNGLKATYHLNGCDVTADINI